MIAATNTHLSINFRARTADLTTVHSDSCSDWCVEFVLYIRSVRRVLT